MWTCNWCSRRANGFKRNVDEIGYLFQDYVKRNYNYIPVFNDGSKDPGNEHVGAEIYR